MVDKSMKRKVRKMTKLPDCSSNHITDVTMDKTNSKLFNFPIPKDVIKGIDEGRQYKVKFEFVFIEVINCATCGCEIETKREDNIAYFCNRCTLNGKSKGVKEK